MRFAFPYRRYDVDPSPADPSPFVYRPLVPVRILGPGGEAFSLAMIDTGADVTILQGDFIRELGVAVNRDPGAGLRAANDQGLPVVYGEVEFRIGQGGQSLAWRAVVGFSHALRRSILGRAGCLDRLSVTLDGPGRMVTIEGR